MHVFRAENKFCHKSWIGMNIEKRTDYLNNHNINFILDPEMLLT